MTDEDDLDAKIERAKIAYEQAQAMFQSDKKRKDYWSGQAEQSNRVAHKAFLEWLRLRDQKTVLKGLL